MRPIFLAIVHIKSQIPGIENVIKQQTRIQDHWPTTLPLPLSVSYTVYFHFIIFFFVQTKVDPLIDWT